MDVLVVGSVALDSVETPVHGLHADQLGGSAAHFAVAASLLTKVGLVGVVGDDFPEEHVALLADRGIDLAGLTRAPGTTFRWHGRYLYDMVQRETLSTELGVFEQFAPSLSPAYRQVPYVFLANIHPALQLQVLEQADHPKLVALDTMNLWIDNALAELSDVMGRVQLLLLNDEEARILAGEHNIIRAAAGVRRLAKNARVIVKRGDAGALLFDDAGVFACPAFPTADVVDPTGAGDSFAGGMMSYLAKSGEVSAKNLRTAMVFGSAVASFEVESFSCRRLLEISVEDVLARCRAIGHMTEFSPVVA